MRSTNPRLPGWYRVALMLIVLGIVAYRGLQVRSPAVNEPVARQAPRQVDRSPAEKSHEISADATRDAPLSKLRPQIIRDLQGHIAYRGEIDLQPTLARIARDQRLRFPNDGAVFHNRERRLPQRPDGYYREFVHPTPGLSGPGPQRIVAGEHGELFYTPDHYRTFQRLDEE